MKKFQQLICYLCGTRKDTTKYLRENWLKKKEQLAVVLVENQVGGMIEIEIEEIEKGTGGITAVALDIKTAGHTRGMQVVVDMEENGVTVEMVVNIEAGLEMLIGIEAVATGSTEIEGRILGAEVVVDISSSQVGIIGRGLVLYLQLDLR